MGQLLVRHFWKEIEEIKMIDDLDKIVIPALIQGGKYDLGPPSSVMETVYNEIGSTSKYLNIYEHSGHAAFETEPDPFVNNVIDFVELHK
jgi:esterase/lipase